MNRTQRRGVLVLAGAAASLALVAAVARFFPLAVIASIAAAASVMLATALEYRRAQTPESIPLALPEPTAFRMPVALEPPAVVHALLENATAAGDAVAAHLWLEDPASATLRLVASDGARAPAPTPVPIAGSLLGRTLSGGSALLEPVSHVRGIDEDSVVWRYTIPLEAGEAHGVAAVDIAGSDSPDASILTSLAPALRGALAGALALHVARIETDAARTLLETARDLSRLLDPGEVIRNALERAMELGSATTGSIMLLGQDARTMTIAAAKGLPSQVVNETVVAEGEGLAGWVLASRQALVVVDLPGTANRSRRRGVKSAVSVPIA
ncbi:MAG: GAF domain-containing protein, partial [Actinomycetota bacterium]|nr:GAF domain-containing protein [Actinomycetota bacterium]